MMTSDPIALPKPKEIDDTRSMELRHLSTNAVLRGRPSGDQQYGNCRYYLENTAEITKVRRQIARINTLIRQREIAAAEAES